MRAKLLGAVLSAAAAIVVAEPRPAAADAGWEVCALLYREGGPITQCDFRTFEQCRATAGNGGTCYTNPQPRSIDRSFARAPRNNR